MDKPEKMIVATDADGVKRWVPAPVTSPPTVPDGYPCPLCGAMFPLNPDGCKSTCEGCGMSFCGDPVEVESLLIPVLNEADWEVLRKARLPSRYLPEKQSEPEPRNPVLLMTTSTTVPNQPSWGFYPRLL